MRTIINSVSTMFVWILAGIAIYIYFSVNILFGAPDVGAYVAGGCASIPILLFGVACIRNGVRFTVGHSLGLLLLSFVSFIIYGMDMGILSFLLCGVVAVIWMGILIFWALAYRPEEGAFGQLISRGRGAMAGVVRPSGGSGAPPAGVNLLTLLLVCNLIVSLMGVLV